MDPIPVSLYVANASTLLAWICAYVPHWILLTLFAFALVVLSVLVVLALCLLIRTGFALLNYCSRRLAPRSITRSPVRLPTPRPPNAQAIWQALHLLSRLPQRCPHCSHDVHTPSVRLPNAQTRATPRRATPLRSAIRRASDSTPSSCYHDASDDSSSLYEPPITTPPQRARSPPKATPRRSVRMRRPRKFSF